MLVFKWCHDFFQITPGSKAAAANLCPGDVILAIDGFGTESMTHADAQDRIKAAAHQLCLKIDRCFLINGVKISSVLQKILNQNYKWFHPPCKKEFHRTQNSEFWPAFFFF